jgi:hypothetical protein
MILVGGARAGDFRLASGAISKVEIRRDNPRLAATKPEAFDSIGENLKGSLGVSRDAH